MAEETVQTHEPTVAPTPNSNSPGIHIRPLPQTSGRGGLIPSLHHAELAVHRLSPAAAEGGRGAAIVYAGDEVPPLGEHQMPEVVTAPGVGHRG
jgi:hypothetical protein